MYLFNPDNDLALANFSTNYTPPAAAQKIARDLAVLPVWYAVDNAMVVAEGKENELFLSRLKKLLPIKSTLISFSELSHFPEEEIIPWGWSPLLRKKLLSAGVREERLPCMEELRQLRHYSGRQHAVQMLRELKALRNDFCGESHFFDNVEDLTDYLSTEIYSVLKMPNSGSGKGLVWIIDKITDKQTYWCRRVINEQGGVVAEPVLKKTVDFAMEFELHEGNSSFKGYSLFQSAASGAYMGNSLLLDKVIENRLSQFISVETLRWLTDVYLRKLPEYFPHYTGILGVDMMVCETGQGHQIQPCVEMNLRMNMGMVARIFYDRFVSSGSVGEYRVDFFKKRGEAFRFQEENRKKFSLKIENGKIISGFLSLTPVLESTNYVAWVLIDGNV